MRFTTTSAFHRVTDDDDQPIAPPEPIRPSEPGSRLLGCAAASLACDTTVSYWFWQIDRRE